MHIHRQNLHSKWFHYFKGTVPIRNSNETIFIFYYNDLKFFAWIRFFFRTRSGTFQKSCVLESIIVNLSVKGCERIWSVWCHFIFGVKRKILIENPDICYEINFNNAISYRANIPPSDILITQNRLKVRKGYKMVPNTNTKVYFR